MKNSVKYIVFAVVLAAIFLFKFQIVGLDRAQVGEFRGSNLDDGVWNSLVAKDVNSGTFSVVIDSQEYSSDDIGCYMNSERGIMIPVSMLREAFGCSARVYDGNTLLVEKHGLSVSMSVDDYLATSGEDTVVLSSPLTENSKGLFVSLGDLANLLGYSYSIDIGDGIAVAADADNSSVIPTSYDLRDRGRVSVIRNQGSDGTCWAFAATSALESALMPEESPIFSVRHMIYRNSFNVSTSNGGEYTMGMAYLAAWQGPVYDDDYSYELGEEITPLTAVKHVQEMQIIDGKNYEKIKEAVFKYGGVQSSIYSTIESVDENSEYYNDETAAYCYIGTEKPNHDVVIIGWDDSYPSSNFNTQLEGDGAFICQNSWGEDFGEDGVFYVSYYDTNIGTHNVAYTRIDDADNYDHIYQSDLCGWVGKLGYDSEDMYGANVFTAEGDENIVAASFYATGADTEYELSIVKNFKNSASLSDRVTVASGTLSQAGYYTIDFDEPVEVDAGEEYAVVLYVKTPGATHPMAIEYDSGDSTLIGIDLDDGEGYISSNGTAFVNVKTKQQCNLCIKAFSDDR
ncbi:MAG: lectin like domain-containing protein [Clostridiales bacterium]|nr:lectin like domain-containing protein [Clostridiales bacterium]